MRKLTLIPKLPMKGENGHDCPANPAAPGPPHGEFLANI